MRREHIRLIPIQMEEEELEPEQERPSLGELLCIIGAVCAALAAFALVWKLIVKRR